MENISQDERGNCMSWVLTGLGRLEGKKTSGVDLPVSVLDGDGARVKIIGLMLSGHDVCWVDLVAELDGGKCDFSRLISSKSVAEAMTFVTKTDVHGPTFESCPVVWRETRSPQVG